MALKDNKRKDKLVLSLDGDGWLRHNTEERIDRLMSHFFTSDGLQSSLYYRDFMTYQVIHAEHNNDIQSMAVTLNEYLQQYLSKFIDNINVTVSTTEGGVITDPADIEGAVVGLLVEIEYAEGTNINQITKPVFYKDGLFRYTLGKFNTGT